MSQILKDKTRSGKIRPWKSKKIDNLTYSEYLEVLRFRKAGKVKECGNVLNFVKRKDGSLRLYQTWFCKSRLCPLCSWRRAMKNSNQLKRILKEAHNEYPKGRFLFLTLTERNSDANNLKSSIRKMGRSFYKLFQYKKVKKNLLGYVRSTEITVNREEETYHPHMHVLLFVSSNYFRNSNQYITQDEWTKFWKKALKIDYTPVVNIETIKPKYNKKNKSDLLSSADEAAKYQVKSSDYISSDKTSENIDKDIKITEVLEQSLDHTRAISYGKLFKVIRKKLQLEDEDDLVDTNDENEEDSLDKDSLVVAKWNYQKRNYYINL